jgi:hypothetical protein
LKKKHVAYCQHPDCKQKGRGIFAIESTDCIIHPYSSGWNLDKKANYKGDTTPPPVEPKIVKKKLGDMLQVTEGKLGHKTGKGKNQKTKGKYN